MEFLKDILGERYEDFCAAVDAYNESNPEGAVELANIAGGEYVEKSVYDDLIRRIEQMQEQTGDVEKIRSEYEQMIQKLSAELDAGKFNNAVEIALINAGAKNLKAAKALLDLENLPKDDNGLLAAYDRIEQIRGECGYLFSSAANATGMRQSGFNRSGGAAEELRSALFGRKK